MNYRNAKLLRAVREAPCMMCGIQDGTVVAAHSNQLRDGKGRGIKAHDYRIAALCYRCHAEYDQGKTMNKTEKIDFAYRNNAKTLRRLLEEGFLAVVD